MHYNRAGEQISFDEWCELMRNKEYRWVEHTDLPDGSFVTTMWLGRNHGGGEGAPLIFESLDFPDQQHLRLYSTEAEARAGHLELVAELTPRG